MARNKGFGDCSISVAECLDEGKTILMAIQKNIQWIIIQSDSHLVFNFINEKIEVRKDIINLVHDVKCLLSRLSESRLEYCNR